VGSYVPVKEMKIFHFISAVHIWFISYIINKPGFVRKSEKNK